MKTDREYPSHGTTNPVTMRYASKRKIIAAVLGITVFKVLLLYLALMYVDNLHYDDDIEDSPSSSIAFSEFRNEELIVTEISSEVSLDDLEQDRKLVTDRMIESDNEPLARRNYTREKRMLRESRLHFSPQIISTSKIERLLPSVENPVNDRIFEQMNHVPLPYQDRNNFKTIYLFGGRRGWGHPEGQTTFLSEECLVNRCRVTYDKNAANKADAVVFGNPNQIRVHPPLQKTNRNQIWILSAIEAPPNTGRNRNYHGLFNWTMTYRTDSIIVTPYFKYKTFPQATIISSKNFAGGRTKKVVWFVSNCNRVNSGRMAYARELQKYISVDVYGRCGNLNCPKTNPRCNTMVKTDYKFYLAFENNKCKNYMTEKIMTAYENDVIPIVLGAASWEYKNALPSHSYIDVDDFETPRDLAQYLQKLDENDDLYNEYFRWKSYGDFVVSKPWCRVCSLLHEPALPAIWYDDVDAWWRSEGTCIDSKTKWSSVPDK